MRFWDEDALDGASKTVHVHVWRLRKALGDPDLIATTPAGYCLRVQPDELDPASFERVLDDGRQALSSPDPVCASCSRRSCATTPR
jgi:DNA-binding SARP family transcriptional activator